MCSGEALMAPMNAQSQYAQGKQNESYYNYLADQTSKQSKELDASTEEQLSVINTDASRQNKEVIDSSNQNIATQKAVMAANGVYSDSGTFSEIIGDSVDRQAMDEAAVKYNADQASWQTKRNTLSQKMGLSAQQASQRIQATNARSAGKIGAFSTMVGGAYSGGAALGSGKFAKFKTPEAEA